MPKRCGGDAREIRGAGCGVSTSFQNFYDSEGIKNYSLRLFVGFTISMLGFI
jgi:hypothetical protein